VRRSLAGHFAGRPLQKYLNKKASLRLLIDNLRLAYFYFSIKALHGFVIFNNILHMNNNLNKSSFVPFSAKSQEPCFLLPEGCFTAKAVKGSYEKDANGRQKAVILFQIESFKKPNTQYMARAVYWENEISKLQEHILSWKGADYLEAAIMRGGLDLEALVGEIADLDVVHNNSSSNHKEALRVVNGIYPPHQLVKSDWSQN
jgi:hypothetical protein